MTKVCYNGNIPGKRKYTVLDVAFEENKNR